MRTSCKCSASLAGIRTSFPTARVLYSAVIADPLARLPDVRGGQLASPVLAGSGLFAQLEAIMGPTKELHDEPSASM